MENCLDIRTCCFAKIFSSTIFFRSENYENPRGWGGHSLSRVQTFHSWLTLTLKFKRIEISNSLRGIELHLAQLYSDDELISTWSEGDPHLNGYYGRDLSTSSIEVFLQLRQKHTKAERKTSEVFTVYSQHLLSPVHHTVPDDVPHEAGKDGHPSPESSIRCRWRRHCCVCKWVLWLRLEAGRETQAEVFHQALTTLHCQLVQLSLTRSSLSSVTLWQTCSVWSISIIIHYNDDREILMFVTINFVRVEIHLPAPKITMQYKNWIDNRIIIHIISIEKTLSQAVCK